MQCYLLIGNWKTLWCPQHQQFDLYTFLILGIGKYPWMLLLPFCNARQHSYLYVGYLNNNFLQTKNTALSIYKFQNVTIPLLDNKASSKFKNKSFSFILLYSTFPCGFVVAKSFRFRLWIRVFVFVIISSLLRKWSVCIRGQYITYKTSLWRTIIHLLRVM